MPYEAINGVFTPEIGDDKTTTRQRCLACREFTLCEKVMVQLHGSSWFNFVLSCLVLVCVVLPLSDHVCLVVAGPGVKGIIGMHRFNFKIVLPLSCRSLALV